jgi:methanethiol S-methyltransferase
VKLVAWLGGLAFVASLGYLVYFYVVVLGSAAGDPHDILINALIDAALFFAFALHHSLFARAWAKTAIARWVSPDNERTVYVWVSSILAFVVGFAWQPIPGVIYEVEGAWRLVFYGVQASGLALTVRGAGVIDPLELAGIRQASARESAQTIRVVGPFRMVRHPIYLGWMLMVFGAPTMTANRLLFAVLSSLYLILAIPWEEKSLVAAHGDRYRAYQQQVRWRVLPGIW